MYESTDSTKLILCATDRVSAFDKILNAEIPGKGKYLTALSAFWSIWAESEGYDTAYCCCNVDTIPLINPYGKLDDPEFNTKELAGRCTKMEKLKMFPIECIVRGRMYGSLWTAYQQGQYVFCGETLPRGLKKGDELEPIFTPTTKAPQGQHDENITFDEFANILCAEGHSADTAETVRELCINLYKDAYQYVAQRGLILMDTKFELGVDRYGTIRFGDELLTPDSSRYMYETKDVSGRKKFKSMDKQIIRDFIAEQKTLGIEHPELTPEIIEATARAYAALIERLTRCTL
ncbi:phosphoribosylaminoimidazolesuccinocarboxamide synthase [Candidatus Saccharibacteria bacterium]|nr:phosphoribosylaminoimidazolesuccinocarboxamide synthase [Candidatus Saccharibacteria bacterium]